MPNTSRQYLSAIKKELTKKPQGKSVVDAWKKVINEMRDERIETVPKGYYTVEQIAKMIDRSVVRTRKIVRDLNKADKIKLLRLRRRSGEMELLTTVNHYTLP